MRTSAGAQVMRPMLCDAAVLLSAVTSADFGRICSIHFLRIFCLIDSLAIQVRKLAPALRLAHNVLTSSSFSDVQNARLRLLKSYDIGPILRHATVGTHKAQLITRCCSPYPSSHPTPDMLGTHYVAQTPGEADENVDLMPEYPRCWRSLKEYKLASHKEYKLASLTATPLGATQTLFEIDNFGPLATTPGEAEESVVGDAGIVSIRTMVPIGGGQTKWTQLPAMEFLWKHCRVNQKSPPHNKRAKIRLRYYIRAQIDAKDANTHEKKPPAD